MKKMVGNWKGCCKLLKNWCKRMMINDSLNWVIICWFVCVVMGRKLYFEIVLGIFGIFILILIRLDKNIRNENIG